MKLKMESSGGNGKTPTKTTTSAVITTSTMTTTTTTASSSTGSPGTGTQQNGVPSASTTSATSGSSRLHQNGSKHRSTTKSTAISTAGVASSSSSSLPTPSSSGVGPSQSSWQFRFSSTLPLRILVLKDLVGAIIGRGGGTIRQITQETHARVDVHRKESSSPSENIIMIYGNPDNCSQACRRILEVMQQEAKSLNRQDEIPLKILASNTLIGRIIGKGGNTIKRIMQQTDTKITISSANLASQYQLERIISITGQLDNMCNAEVMISQKLRQCFESDYMQYQQMMLSGFHSVPPLLPPVPGQPGPLGLPPAGYGVPGPPHSQPHQPPPPMSYPLPTQSTCSNIPPSALVGRGPAGVLTGSSVSSPPSSATGISSQSQSVPPTPTTGPAFYSPYNPISFMYPPHTPGTGLSGPFGPTGPSGAPYMNINYLSPVLPNWDAIKETVTIYIPNSVVGAIIGRGGSTIREMTNNSGALIRVAQMTEEESAASTESSSSSSGSGSKILERRVTIFGNHFSQSQAQYFVFQKVSAELSNQLSQQGSSPGSICPYGDPFILKVEIMVPTNQVRRIVGKGGSVITDLQRSSGATIKLSKESSQASSATASSTSSKQVPISEHQSEPSATTSPNGGGETEKSTTATTSASTTTATTEQDMTSVFIIGDFPSSYNAQRQIRMIVYRSSSSTAVTTPSSVPFSSTTTISSRFKTGGETTTTTVPGEESKSTTKTRSTTSSNAEETLATSTTITKASSSSAISTTTATTTATTTRSSSGSTSAQISTPATSITASDSSTTTDSPTTKTTVTTTSTKSTS